LRLDVGKIFGGLVGASEENIRKALKTAEAIAPAVLWLDEMEKGFSGTGSSKKLGGRPAPRAVRHLLGLVDGRKAPVFAIATANDVRSLPPELLRKGRFDEIFFVDLPSRDERKQVFEIHLKKKRRDPATLDLGKIVEATPEFSGAEIEQAVVSALYDAFDGETDLTTEGIVGSASESVRLAVTMKEGIDGMREWARTRARPASTAQEKRPQKDPFAITIEPSRKLEV